MLNAEGKRRDLVFPFLIPHEAFCRCWALDLSHSGASYDREVHSNWVCVAVLFQQAGRLATKISRHFAPWGRPVVAPAEAQTTPPRFWHHPDTWLSPTSRSSCLPMCPDPGAFHGRSALLGECLRKQCLETPGLMVPFNFGGGSCQGIPMESRLWVEGQKTT